jgi:peptidoglycan/LPS O-acetylase OafA/YrhL
VLEFHGSASRLPGGFLGVDVFFVLSGYLITQLLLEERVATGRIRVAGFWARRARRLLPAVLLLLLVCAFITARSAPTLTLSFRRDDMFSTLFYYANWHFIGTGQSYFATFAGASPLLHTWSLAIEEQFYLLWPLLLAGLLLLTRRRRWVLYGLIVAGAVASAIAMAIHYSPADPLRSYYGTDTRAHALLIGATLAAVVHQRPELLTSARARLYATWLAPAVAAAVLFAFLRLGDQDPFYYRGGSVLFALVVAVGVWAVEARPGAFPAAVLSMPPVVWVGRISYGLYLWHWPVFVWIEDSARFASWSPRQRELFELVVTFATAAASFYLLEQPVRSGRVPWLKRSGWRLAVAVVVTVSLVAVVVVRSTRISSPFAKQVLDISDADCPAASPGVGGYRWCARTPPSGRESPTVAVAGDSTARALDPGMRETANKRGWSYIQAGQNNCSLMPLVLPASTTPAELAIEANCSKYIPQLLSQVLSDARPNVWITSDVIAPDHLLVEPDGKVLNVADPRRAAIMIPSLRSMVSALTSRGAWLVFVKTPPTGEPADCAVPHPAATCSDPVYSLRQSAGRSFDRIVRRAIAGLPRVVYISIDDVLCPGPGGQCRADIGGVLARYDGIHFTRRFSRAIVPIIIARAERAGVPFSQRAH